MQYRARHEQADPKFSNDEIEWKIRPQDGRYATTEQVICYGILIRKRAVTAVPFGPAAAPPPAVPRAGKKRNRNGGNFARPG
jgi:hypothetical protein